MDFRLFGGHTQPARRSGVAIATCYQRTSSLVNPGDSPVSLEIGSGISGQSFVFHFALFYFVNAKFR